MDTVQLSGLDYTHTHAKRHHFSENKNLMSVKVVARDSRAGNACANFMGAWDFWFFLQENLHAQKIPLPGGGWEVPTVFLWVRGSF